MEEEARPLIAKSQFSRKDAAYEYRYWVEKQRFVVKDFDIDGKLKKIKGIWVPVWLFEVSADSSWHGEVSHTESYSRVEYDYIKDRDVHYTEDEEVWNPVSSTHYGNYLQPVSASRVITQKEIEFPKSTQLDLENYDESRLGKWKVQAIDLDKMEAREICTNRIKELETKACSRQVERLNGCSIKLTYKTSNFALLPMFVLAYTYKDNSYRNTINGLTGEVYGDKVPINKRKKWLVTMITVVAVIVGFIMFLAIIGGR